jgi:hypothetical protein
LGDEIKKTIDDVDRRFVCNLYNYRSRLLHNVRDKHKSEVILQSNGNFFFVQITPSATALKHFKEVLKKDDPPFSVTLTYLSSWLIKKAFIELEKVLDALSVEIKKNSHFQKNIRQPKRGKDSFMIVSVNDVTRFAEPISNDLWKQYKAKAVDL